MRWRLFEPPRGHYVAASIALSAIELRTKCAVDAQDFFKSLFQKENSQIHQSTNSEENSENQEETSIAEDNSGNQQEITNSEDSSGNQEETHSEPSEPQIQKTTATPRGDYVQIYNPDDLTQPVQTFQGIAEAIQTVPDANLSQIKAAFQLKTVYKGYRWHLVPRSDPNPYVVKNIGLTVDKRDHNSGYIVKLNLERNEILELYTSQADAQEKDGTKKSWISKCIKSGNPTKGIYWERFDNLPEEMRNNYLAKNTLPVIDNIKARKIVCKEPNTKEVKEIFKSMEEVQRKYGITSKTLKKYVDSKEPYKGFIWEFE